MLLLTIHLLLSYVTATNNFPDVQEQNVNFRMLANKICDVSFDLMIVMDLSASMIAYLDYTKQELLQMVDSFLAAENQNRLSVAYFRDKPVAPFGYKADAWEDCCFKTITPFSASVDEHKQAISGMSTGGGVDFAEAQLDALARAAYFPGWDQDVGSPVTRQRLRVLLMITDSYPHFSRDYVKLRDNPQYAKSGNPQYPSLRPFNPLIYSKSFKSDQNYGCAGIDYPAVSDVEEILRKSSIIPIFLVHPAGYFCNEDNGICAFPEMNETNFPDVKSVGNPTDGMVSMYESLFKSFHLPKLVRIAGLDYRGLRTELIRYLRKAPVHYLLCKENLVSHENTGDHPMNLAELFAPVTKSMDTIDLPRANLYFNHQPPGKHGSGNHAGSVVTNQPSQENKGSGHDKNKRNLAFASEGSKSSELSEQRVPETVHSGALYVAPEVGQFDETATQNFFVDEAGRTQAAISNTVVSNEWLRSDISVLDEKLAVDPKFATVQPSSGLQI